MNGLRHSDDIQFSHLSKLFIICNNIWNVNNIFLTMPSPNGLFKHWIKLQAIRSLFSSQKYLIFNVIFIFSSVINNINIGQWTKINIINFLFWFVHFINWFISNTQRERESECKCFFMCLCHVDITNCLRIQMIEVNKNRFPDQEKQNQQKCGSFAFNSNNWKPIVNGFCVIIFFSLFVHWNRNKIISLKRCVSSTETQNRKSVRNLHVIDLSTASYHCCYWWSIIDW